MVYTHSILFKNMAHKDASLPISLVQAMVDLGPGHSAQSPCLTSTSLFLRAEPEVKFPSTLQALLGYATQDPFYIDDGQGPEEECKLGQGYVLEERGGEKKQQVD